MVWLRKIIRVIDKRKYEYFFGFGADNQSEMIEAVIENKPEYIGRASLQDYQLCIQSLDDIPTKGSNPRKILYSAWGEGFQSYTIRYHKGQHVHGSLFKISRYERKMLDSWELVGEGWQNSVLVKVVLGDGKVIVARTQRLPKEHDSGKTADGITYDPWLMPKKDFIRLARIAAENYKKAP